MTIFDGEKTLSLPWNFYSQPTRAEELPAALSVKCELDKNFNLCSGNIMQKLELQMYELALKELAEKGITLENDDLIGLLECEYKRDRNWAHIQGELCVLTAIDTLPEIPEIMLMGDLEANDNPRTLLPPQGYLKYMALSPR